MVKSHVSDFTKLLCDVKMTNLMKRMEPVWCLDALRHFLFLFQLESESEHHSVREEEAKTAQTAAARAAGEGQYGR